MTSVHAGADGAEHVYLVVVHADGSQSEVQLDTNEGEQS